jgi:hypothetical protein
VMALLLTIAVVGLLLAQVRLTAGPGGAVVALGPLGIPYVRIPLDEVASAAVEEVTPLAYGGWGYRVRPGVRAFVIRAGQGVRLRRTGKPDLVITVDDAERGAGVVNALIGVGQPPS